MDHDIRHEYQLQQRVIALESRVLWLEEALSRVLGEPGAGVPARATPALSALEVERHLLRTRPMDARAWASLEQSVHGTLAVLGSTGATLELVPLESSPSARKLSDTASRFAGITPPAPRAPAAPDMLPPIMVRPVAAPPAAAAPAPKVPPAPSRPAINLGITAAFETLELKVADAAAEELGAGRKRGPDAPMIEILPDMLDAALLRPQSRPLYVRCALEEQVPSILQQLIATWRGPESDVLLKKLIRDDHGSRLGLDPDVREELTLLMSMRETDAA